MLTSLTCSALASSLNSNITICTIPSGFQFRGCGVEAPNGNLKMPRRATKVIAPMMAILLFDDSWDERLVIVLLAMGNGELWLKLMDDGDELGVRIRRVR